MNDITILTTGAGSPGAAGIFRALRTGARGEGRNLKIITCDMDSDAYGFHLADGYHVIPAGTEPNFINNIIEICRKEKPDLLFSWVDPELLPIAENREFIEESGARVLISDADAIETCIDKSKVYKLAAELGIAPEFRITDNHKDFETAVRALGYPNNPVCFKPAKSYGGRGFRVLEPGSDRLKAFFNEKPDNTRTTLEDILTIFEGTELPRLMVMEYLPGKEYTVDMLLDREGKPVITIPRIRSRVKLGISNIARLEKNEAVIGAAENITGALKLRYNANIQFKLDNKGRPKLIEVQPRLAGTTAASVGAGANLPWLAAKLALGEEIRKPEINWNTTTKRFWNEVHTNGGKEWF